MTEEHEAVVLDQLNYLNLAAGTELALQLAWPEARGFAVVVHVIFAVEQHSSALRIDAMTGYSLESERSVAAAVVETGLYATVQLHWKNSAAAGQHPPGLAVTMKVSKQIAAGFVLAEVSAEVEKQLTAQLQIESYAKAGSYQPVQLVMTQAEQKF